MKRDWELVKHSVLFVLGFSLVFAVVGVLIQYFFAHLGYTLKTYFSYVGGALIIFFGILLTGLVRIPFLERERRLQVRSVKHPSIMSFLFGAAFGAGWSPCVGAILGAMLTLAATQPTSALVLMLAYSAGLGVPFILAGLFADHTKGLIHRLGDKLRYVQIVLGGLLVVLGVMIFTQQLVQIAELTASSAFFHWIDTGLASVGMNVAVAFIAGLASFFSPCVLPMLPVYLAYLAGIAAKK